MKTKQRKTEKGEKGWTRRERARWWLLEINEKGLNIRKTERGRERKRERE